MTKHQAGVEPPSIELTDEEKRRLDPWHKMAGDVDYIQVSRYGVYVHHEQATRLLKTLRAMGKRLLELEDTIAELEDRVSKERDRANRPSWS